MRAIHWTGLIPALWLLLLSHPSGRLEAQALPVDSAGLGTGPHSRMHMLLEKTIFKVDVLTLEIRFGSRVAARLDSLLAGREHSRELADSVAAIALEARDVWARIRFKRGVGLDRFLDGIRDNLHKAQEAGIVTPEDEARISAALPGWYAFLADRGIRSGDEMLYRIRGDTLRTVYTGIEGDVLLDQVNVGPERRLSVLGGYFAPGSDFRDKLIRSLFVRPSRG